MGTVMIVWLLHLQLLVQSMPFTSNVVSLHVIKFVTDLWQVGGFLWVLQFPAPIKLTTMIYLKYC